MSEKVAIRYTATKQSGSIVVSISPNDYRGWSDKNKFPAPRLTFTGKHVDRLQWVFSNLRDPILYRLTNSLEKSGLFSTGAETQKRRITILSAAPPPAVAPLLPNPKRRSNSRQSPLVLATSDDQRIAAIIARQQQKSGSRRGQRPSRPAIPSVYLYNAALPEGVSCQ